MSGAGRNARYDSGVDRLVVGYRAACARAEAAEPEVGPPTPLGALKFRMEQGGHTQADLAKLIGHRGHASEILSGKRSLSKAQIATLADEWGIPARSLLGEGIHSQDGTTGRIVPAREESKSPLAQSETSS